MPHLGLKSHFRRADWIVRRESKGSLEEASLMTNFKIKVSIFLPHKECLLDPKRLCSRQTDLILLLIPLRHLSHHFLVCLYFIERKKLVNGIPLSCLRRT